MIDPTTADKATETEIEVDEQPADDVVQAGYEHAALEFLQNETDWEDLTWSERRDLFRDDDGDLDLSDENLPSDLLVLEDFHAEFVYEVKAVFHLFDVGDEEQAIKTLSNLVKDHLADGNNKVTETTAILNLNAAGDCPNRQTERCQVPWSACYAHKSEDLYTNKRESDGRYVGPLVARRREEILRDTFDAETYARAFIAMNERKRKPFDTLRVSESGDFRHEGDIKWVNTLARILAEEQGIDTYTYSASSDLNWSLAEHFTVNASNDFEDYGDARFKAEDPDDFEPAEDEMWCPNDMQKAQGKSADEAIKCGECRLCVDKNDIDVVIPLH